MESESPLSRFAPPDLPTRDSVAEWSISDLIDALMSVAGPLGEISRQNTDLDRDNAELALRVEDLERSRRLDSTNRGKRPSSDGPKVPVKHLNETSPRVECGLRWLHVTCSNLMSHFRLGDARGDVSKDLEGIAIHDNMASYVNIGADATHAPCNAHHLR